MTEIHDRMASPPVQAAEKKPSAPPSGQDAYVAGKLGRDAKCGTIETPAVLAAKGSGF